MSKQYMVVIPASISNGHEEEKIVVSANSEREAVTMIAQGRAIKGHNGPLKVVKGSTRNFKYDAFWVRKTTGAYTGQKWLVTEVVEAPAAEVVEAPAAEVVEAPAAEVITEEHTVTMSVEEKRAAWDIFVKEWAKGHAEDIHAIRAAEAKDATMDAEARIVEDVDASYDDDAIDEALDAIREAVIAGRSYAHLIEEAQDLGATRHAISDVIRSAKASV